MALIADGLLIVAGLTAGLYCMVLSRRLRKLSDSGQGIGAQIGQLSGAIAETRDAVAEARKGAEESGTRLGRDMRKAEGLIAELRRALAEAEAAAEAAMARPRPPEQDFLSPLPLVQEAAGGAGGAGSGPGAPPPRSARFETVFDDMSDLDDLPPEEDDLERHAPEISSVADAMAADLGDVGLAQAAPGAAARDDIGDDSVEGDASNGSGDDDDAVPPELARAAAGGRAEGVLHVERVAL